MFLMHLFKFNVVTINIVIKINKTLLIVEGLLDLQNHPSTKSKEEKSISQIK